MNIKIIFDDGRELLREDILALDYVTVDDVKQRAEEDLDVKLTEKQIVRIGSIFDQMCNYPSSEDIDDVIRQVVKETK